MSRYRGTEPLRDTCNISTLNGQEFGFHGFELDPDGVSRKPCYCGKYASEADHKRRTALQVLPLGEQRVWRRGIWA